MTILTHEIMTALKNIQYSKNWLDKIEKILKNYLDYKKETFLIRGSGLNLPDFSIRLIHLHLYFALNGNPEYYNGDFQMQ